MRITEIRSFGQIKNGDTLLVDSLHYGIKLYNNVKKKITESDCREVILRKRGNLYFSFDMFSTGKSHVKGIYKIEKSERE